MMFCKTKVHNYEDVQRKAFGRLVREGVYTENFEHLDICKDFFARVISDVFSKSNKRIVSVLECGCGNGAWLYFVAKLLGEHNRYYGFDITPEMIELARKKLEKNISNICLKQGDLLKKEPYELNDGKGFDIIYAYDVVQQLPRKIQFDGMMAMIENLASGGTLIIIDHEKNSLFGLKMEIKKYITRRFKIKLVPQYFCNAKYPQLRKFKQSIDLKYECKILYDTKNRSNKKTALIVKST